MLRALIDAIAAGDGGAAARRLDDAPELAREALAQGAGRAEAKEHFLEALGCYVYAGDTALHVAAAAWDLALIGRLVALGADANARNRRGAAPLHYAANGNPDAMRWNPAAQAGAIGALIAAGADPNAADRNGATPLHRAIRARCAGAVEALLKGGADRTIPTGAGTTCERLAEVATGRGGSGSPAAKAQQAVIVAMLET